MRFLAMIVVSLSLGCGPASPTRPIVKQVGWVELVNYYRDSRTDAEQTYGGKQVQVYLPRKSFRVHHDRIEAYLGMTDRPGCLVFEVKSGTSGGSAVLVTGICRGVVHDGIERANGINWFVRVESCVVTELN